MPTPSLGSPPLLEQVDGMGIAAFGVGHVPETWVPILHKAAEHILIVFASRTGGGTTLTHLIGAGHLDPYKARHLHTVLLRSGADLDKIRATFAPAGTTAEGRG